MKTQPSFTEEEVLTFWKLCGWRYESKAPAKAGDKPSEAMHHPDCKCEGFGPTCTCLILCNKINDPATIFYAISEGYLKKRKVKTVKMNLGDTPSFQYAAMKAILDQNN